VSELKTNGVVYFCENLPGRTGRRARVGVICKRSGMCGRLAYAFEQATKRRVPPPAAP
jgi:hypothetical protein